QQPGEQVRAGQERRVAGRPFHRGDAPAGGDSLQDGMDRLIVGADDVRGRAGAPRPRPPLPPAADQGRGADAGEGRAPRGAVAARAGGGWGGRGGGGGGEGPGPRWGAPGGEDPRRYRLVAGRVAARLAVIERHPAQVDQMGDGRMAAGLGDHRAAIGVTGQDDGAVERVEHAADVRGVAVQVAQWAGVIAVARQVDGQRRDTGGGERGAGRLPAPGAVPGAVDQDNGGWPAGQYGTLAGHASHRRPPPEVTDACVRQRSPSPNPSEESRSVSWEKPEASLKP